LFKIEAISFFLQKKILYKLCLVKGSTQEQLAHEFGVEIPQISRIERGVINTSVITLYAIFKVLNVDISELLNFD
jgi:transcriptional regulator with XRE-family HTH domain